MEKMVIWLGVILVDLSKRAILKPTLR